MVLDPVIVAVMAGVHGRYDGHFWAKAPLFKGVLGYILRQCGGVRIPFLSRIRIMNLLYIFRY